MATTTLLRMADSRALQIPPLLFLSRRTEDQLLAQGLLSTQVFNSGLPAASRFWMLTMEEVQDTVAITDGD